MNDMRPEIRELSDCITNADRARVLTRMSPSILMTCEFTIRNRLMCAGYRDGIDFLDAELALLRSPRNGAVPHPEYQARKCRRDLAEQVLLELAYRQPPNHDQTEV